GRFPPDRPPPRSPAARAARRDPHARPEPHPRPHAAHDDARGEDARSEAEVRMRKEMLESFVLGDVLRSQAQAHRRQPFLRFRDGEITFGEVDAAADRMARRLAGAGVEPGDHVALMLPNCADFVHLIFALARLGAVAVPVNVAYRGELLRHVLDGSDSRWLVIDGSYAARIPEIAERLPKLDGVIVRDAAASGVLLERLGRPARELSALPE